MAFLPDKNRETYLFRSIREIFERKLRKHKVHRKAPLILFCLSLLVPNNAPAGGFQNDVQSATAASVSTAGETAAAEDATTIYYNAAGMGFLDRPEITGAIGLGSLQSSFNDAGTTDAVGGPIVGNTGVNPPVITLPSLFGQVPLNRQLHVGLGIFIPFGETTKYDDDWVGRYQVQQASLSVYDIDPAVAYRITEWLSVGGGIDFQVMQFSRQSAIDFGSACVAALEPTSCRALGLVPQGADGRLTSKLGDWAVGYNFGIIIQPDIGTRLGISYRSMVQHNLSGTASFVVPAVAQPLTGGGSLFQSTGATSTVVLPDTIAAGLSRKLTDQITVLADLRLSLWNRLNHLTLDFSNPAQAAITQPLHWHDSIVVALGGTYQLTQSTTIRTGVSFDQSPIPSQYRTADLPGADAITLSIGVSQRLADHVTGTLSYSYVRQFGTTINLAVPGEEMLVGTVRQSANVVGAQMRFTF